MSTASPAKPSRSERPQLSRLFPGRVATTIVLVCLVVMLLVRVFRDEMTILIKMFDTSAANLASLVLSLIIVLTLLVWFLCFSDYSSRTKAKAMMLLGACLALGFVGFQLDGPTGDMEFAFVPRTWLARLLPADAPPPPQSTDEKIDADLATTTTADFPRFLGPQGTNYLASAGGSPLSRDWTAKPPKLLWRQASGQGWSAFSAVNGFAVTLEQHGDDEWVTCYEVRTGKLVWTRVTPGRHEAAMGGIGPRSTPSIHQGRVYTIGGTGLLQCLDGKRGEVLWSDDLVRRCGSTPELEKMAIMWGRAGSPLVVADLGLLVVPGGGPKESPTSLLAYDLATGAVRWKAGTSQISYVTPVECTLAGRRQIISINEADVAGHDIETGSILWSHPWPGSSSGNASCSQPHVLSGDRILLSKGYGEGAEMIRITESGGSLQVETLWKNPRVLKTKFTNVTVIAEHAYGLSDGILECVDLETGKSRWRRGRYGHGQLLGVGDLLLILSESGEVALVEANPSKYVELGRIEALDGKTWNSLALYGKLLLIRNAQQAACYELP